MFLPGAAGQKPHFRLCVMEQDMNNPITIVGLGPGDPGLLTRQAWQLINTAPEIYLRTRHHPALSGFPR